MFRKLKQELGDNDSDGTYDDDSNREDFGISDKFWIADEILHQKEFKRTNGNCCFNHQIGLPRRKIPPYDLMPIFGYEMEIVSNIEYNPYYALNKARGIGATEIILRWILFSALHNNIPSRKFLIVVATRGEQARVSIKRISDMMVNISAPLVKSTTQEKLVIGMSEIIAMPAEPNAIRGYENVGVIFADEAAHWDLLDDEPVLEAIEPHRTKSDARIIVVSTPNGRRGFFAKIFHNKNTKYFRDVKPWIVSKDLLVRTEEVEKIRNEEIYRYEQEYNCQFLSSRYAAFPPSLLEIARQKSQEYQLRD